MNSRVKLLQLRVFREILILYCLQARISAVNGEDRAGRLGAAAARVRGRKDPAVRAAGGAAGAVSGRNFVRVHDAEHHLHQAQLSGGAGQGPAAGLCARLF